MQDKAKLGTRYTCFECETKFYDLNRPQPICPECTADQTNAKSLDPLSTRGKMPTYPDPIAMEESADTDADADDEDLDDQDVAGELDES